MNAIPGPTGIKFSTWVIRHKNQSINHMKPRHNADSNEITIQLKMSFFKTFNCIALIEISVHYAVFFFWVTISYYHNENLMIY